MDQGTGRYNLRQRKMVPQANVDCLHSQTPIPSPKLASSFSTSSPLKKQRTKMTSIDSDVVSGQQLSGTGTGMPNGSAPERNNQADIEQSSNKKNANNNLRHLPLGGEDNEGFQETSLTEPLLEGTGSEEEADDINVQFTERPPETEVDFEIQEASWQIGLQIFFPYMIAGFGMVGAGMVLDTVQHWTVFQNVPEAYILVPSLLGLKGNLEMTLASRLSTQANIGNMESKKEKWKMIGGNLALTQAQAIVVGFLASVVAMIFGWVPKGKFDIFHGFLLCASSVTTAAFASFVLGSIMVGVVLGSHKCKINPDNVATPIAASLGDLTTLGLLSLVASFLYKSLETQKWICPVILTVFICLTPLWCVISHRNKYTNQVLYEGWTPVIGAMIISSAGGLILDFGVAMYSGIAVFQPVINGVGGNLIAVQASRLSTALHRVSSPGNLPPAAIQGCPNFCSTFFGKSVSSRTARVLMLLVVPGHLAFMYTIHYLQAGHTSITPIFAVVYLTAALIQVGVLLYICSWLVHHLWSHGNDPDNFSIPYLTAMGDLLGTALLFGAFAFLSDDYLPHFTKSSRLVREFLQGHLTT